MRAKLGICFALLVGTLAAYWPVLRSEFIIFDDPVYVTQNAVVQQGLAPQTVLWAFRTFTAEFWQPLTWLSHMLDFQLYGMQAGGHHVTSLLFHLANTLLLFLVFHKMTGAFWRSGFVAALFALHPLHVESVAWVAERKDVLSTFFGLLSLWAYARYVEQSRIAPALASGGRGGTRKSRPLTGPGSSSPVTAHPSRYYGLSLFLFVCSLMSKPMFVTLPFVLLLLDYWPLQRFDFTTRRAGLKGLLREKLPFMGLSLAACVAAYLIQASRHNLGGLEQYPLSLRLANGLMSYFGYLRKLVWPADLAVFYPYPEGWPAGPVLGAGLVLGAVSVLALWRGVRRPYLAVGWLWYLGTLVPVIGLVQVSHHAMADRYTYVPLIGVFVMLAWGLPELLVRSRNARKALPFAATAVLLLCAFMARTQAACWKNSETLFRHALLLNPANYAAHGCLGGALAEQGRFAEARTEFSTALKLKPSFTKAHSDMAKLLYEEGKLDAAAALFKKVLELQPGDAEASRYLALVLAEQNQQGEAALAHYSSGDALLKAQRTREALDQFHQALRLRPDWPEVLNNLAWALATHAEAPVRNGAEAVSLAQRACQLSGNTNLWFLSTLAAAYAEAGSFAEAVSTQEQVCKLAAAQGAGSSSEPFQRRLELYRSGQAYRKP